MAFMSQVQSKVQRPPMPSKATEDLADFESRLAPNEREKRQEPKIAAHFLYEQRRQVP